MKKYRLLYRDGDTVFFESGGREVSAIIDGVSRTDFDKLIEAFDGELPSSLVEATVVFSELQFGSVGDRKKPRQFKEAYRAGESTGYSRGFADATRVFSGEEAVSPSGSGRACAACGTFQESRTCGVCGTRTWKMSRPEAWFFGLAKLTESAEVSIDSSAGRVTVSDGSGSATVSVPEDKARVLTEMSKPTLLRFARAHGSLEGSRWDKGFGNFSRRGSRVDPVELLTESVEVKTEKGHAVAVFRESGKTTRVSHLPEEYAKRVSVSGMSAVAAAGLARSMTESTSSANVVTPVGQLAAARSVRMLQEFAGELGVVEYDPKKGFAALAIPRYKGKQMVSFKESFSPYSLEVLDPEDPDYEDAAELGVAAGDPDPEVRAGDGIIVVIIPVLLCGTEDGNVFDPEEERLVDYAADGEEHFVLPSLDPMVPSEETDAALDKLESRGLVERSRGGTAYRLTEAGMVAVGRGD